MRRSLNAAAAIGMAVVIAGVSTGLGWAEQGASQAEKVAQLLSETGAIAKEVARLRGLKVKRPIKRGVMDRAAIRTRIIEELDREYTAKELALEARVLKRLGLLPESADYRQLYIEMSAEQVAGFYDPRRNELNIADWIELAGNAKDSDLGGGRMVMAHEINHALQDQHFDLDAFMRAVKSNYDAASARQALSEGDASALMIEYMFAKEGVDPPWGNREAMRLLESAMTSSEVGDRDKQAKTPLFMRVGMVFPYLEGLRFVTFFRRHHQWREVDRIYRKPPLSTEHILHPESYVQYERPDAITVRSLAALSGYKSIWRNTTGELGFSILLEQHGVSRERARDAAAGWGGDRVVAFAPAKDDGNVAGTVIVSYSVWDDEVDAIELFDAASTALAAMAGTGAVARATELAAAYTSTAGEVFAIERRNDAIVTIIGAPTELAEPLRAQVWKRWRAKRH